MNNAFKTISTLTTIKLTCRCRNVVIVQEITEKKAKNKAVLPNTPTVGFPFPIYSQKLSCHLETAVGGSLCPQLDRVRSGGLDMAAGVQEDLFCPTKPIIVGKLVVRKYAKELGERSLRA